MMLIAPSGHKLRIGDCGLRIEDSIWPADGQVSRSNDK